MSKNSILEGLNINLRPITEGDTKLIVAWRNNPNVRKNFIFREEFTEEMHKRWMDEKVATGMVVQYIIENKAGMPVGSVYFRDIDMHNESAEFGIFIGVDEMRGCGIGTEATKLFVQYGFDELKLHRINLRVLSDNKMAYKAYEKAGFELEGRFRDMVKVDNCYKDVCFMAIVK